MDPFQILYDLCVKLWPSSRFMNRFARLPILGALVRPIYSTRANEAILIPVQEAVDVTESVVLPYAVLDPLVERAGARFLMDSCLCREGALCQSYPHEVGCIFLGTGAAGISPRLGRLVGVEEARSHMERAMELGLVPLVAHTIFDSLVLGIPYRRMIAVCFCCDCCCAIRDIVRTGPPNFWDAVVRLPGLTVNVGEECVACGQCLETCLVEAISLQNGRACIGSDCKGCGRCVELCPVGAIRLHVDENGRRMESLLARIQRRTDIE